jgi:hypothetical protein
LINNLASFFTTPLRVLLDRFFVILFFFILYLNKRHPERNILQSKRDLIKVKWLKTSYF